MTEEDDEISKEETILVTEETENVKETLEDVDQSDIERKQLDEYHKSDKYFTEVC